ncbi:MAG: hypothetical protein QW416_04815 [Candidatus Nitrosocaldaceae archaeon]
MIEILLGDNPFIGVSHLSQDKAREESRESVLENKVKVIEAAINGGATGFTFSTHPLNLELLQYIAKYRRELLDKLDYYILTPYAQSYVRTANIAGTPNLISSIIKRINPSSLTAFLTLNVNKLLGLFLESEIEPYLKILPKKRIKSILIHEVITELLIAFNLYDTLKELDKHFTKKDIDFGVESRNISALDLFLKNNGLNIKYVMTPFNCIGYQMARDFTSAMNAIDNLSRKSKIIAISIFGAGILSLDEVIDYLSKHKDKIYAITTASTKADVIYNNCRRFSSLN